MVWETKKKINERGKHDGSILRQNIVGILPLILETARMITYYGHDIAQHCPYQYRFTYWVPTYTHKKYKNIQYTTYQTFIEFNVSTKDDLYYSSDKVFPLHQRHQTNTANCLLNE